MFGINGSVYIPFFYYNPYHFVVQTPQFLYSEINNLPKFQNSFDTATSLAPSSQIERKTDKENENSELYIPVKSEEKTKEFMKRKLIRKKFQKCVDQVKQAQRLRRKLANRPKTYQTQKKMYLNANLSVQDDHQEGRRTLRKRLQHPKKEKNCQQTTSKFECARLDLKQEKMKFESAENQSLVRETIIKIERNLDFYDPQAKIPKFSVQLDEFHEQMEQKKLSLLIRKIE